MACQFGEHEVWPLLLDLCLRLQHPDTAPPELLSKPWRCPHAIGVAEVVSVPALAGHRDRCVARRCPLTQQASLRRAIAHHDVHWMGRPRIISGRKKKGDSLNTSMVETYQPTRKVRRGARSRPNKCRIESSQSELGLLCPSPCGLVRVPCWQRFPSCLPGRILARERSKRLVGTVSRSGTGTWDVHH